MALKTNQMLSAAFQHISCLSLLLQWIKWKPSEKCFKIWRKNPSWSCQTCLTMNEEWLWVEAGTTQETNNDFFLAFLFMQWSQPGNSAHALKYPSETRVVVISSLPFLLTVSCCEQSTIMKVESWCNKNCWSLICCFSIDYWWVVTCCTLFMSEEMMNDYFIGLDWKADYNNDWSVTGHWSHASLHCIVIIVIIVIASLSWLMFMGGWGIVERGIKTTVTISHIEENDTKYL